LLGPDPSLDGIRKALVQRAGRIGDLNLGFLSFGHGQA
jgi:hypothetical protein